MASAQTTFLAVLAAVLLLLAPAVQAHPHYWGSKKPKGRWTRKLIPEGGCSVPDRGFDGHPGVQPDAG